MKKYFKVVVGVLLTTLLLGCGEEKKEVSKKEVIPQEKELVVGVTSFADTLEPTEQYFGWVVSRYGVGETLTKFDENGSLDTFLATEWEMESEGKEWLFTIREGVKFSDGTLLTPEIVKESLERTFELSRRANTFFTPKKIEVMENKIKITTEIPVATLPGSLADPLFTIVNTKADTSKFAKEGPITTGPYKVSSFNPTEFCIVERNNYYWNGEVPFDKITYKCINDQMTRSLALQSGEIDVAYNLKAENLVDFKDETRYNVDRLESLRTTFAFLNENRVLKDKALREAVAKGVDKKTYTEILLEGGATTGNAPIPPTLDFGFGEVKRIEYNQNEAREILKTAGYKDVDGDGYLETPEGNQLELDFVIYTSREELNVYAQATQTNLKDIGIKVKLTVVSYETFLDLWEAKNFDMLIWNVLVANTGDPEKYLRENWYSTSDSNQTGYNNPKVDELLDNLSKEFDLEKRKALIVNIQNLLMDDIPAIFFGYETTFLISKKNVKGAKLQPIDYYWITKDFNIN